MEIIQIPGTQVFVITYDGGKRYYPMEFGSKEAAENVLTFLNGLHGSDSSGGQND